MDRPSQKVALLVDGDNVPASQAGRLILRAGALGTVVVKRAYVDPSHLPNWAGSGGFGLRVARQGRDAADLLLAIEAVELAHRGDLGAFVLASGDGGFAPLALWLVEQGVTVLGLGPDTAPQDWRQSCTRFEVLPAPGAAAARPAAPTPAAPPPQAPPGAAAKPPAAAAAR